MAEITHTFRLPRAQQIELTEVEAIELRDALNRLYPPPSVLAPLVAPLPHPPAPVWPPLYERAKLFVGDAIQNPYEITCGGDSATAA